VRKELDYALLNLFFVMFRFEDDTSSLFMKRPLLLLFLTIAVCSAKAQVVQWASKVIEFSSELTPIQYSANQALGKPNVLPAGGQNPGAWAPDKPNRNEYLKLGFDNPVSIQQVAIAESHNPSALSRILLYDVSGKEYEVHTFNPGVIPLKGRMLNVFFEMTPYKVAAVRLEFDGAAVPDYYGIDAVAISDSSYPVIAFVPTPELLASGILTESLDSNVNSDSRELNPVLSPDGKTLYFSRKNHPENVGGVNDPEDIWYSELGEDGKWQLAKNMGAPLNNSGPNFVNSISVTADGRTTMLLGNRYEKGGRMSAGVSVSTYDGGQWSAPVPINITNDYNLNERANYFMTNDRKKLLMSVQRRDSYGERDLYVSFQNDDGVWTEPLNLGNVVNTVADESAPFLASDDRTLYFSSNGFSGYGGNDIYISLRLDETWTNWSEPENMGPEINSPMDDLFFNIPSESEYAYYSRQVADNNVDIFRIMLPLYRSPDAWVTVRGKLRDATTGNPVGATVIVEQLPDGRQTATIRSNPETGEYEIKLRAGELYGLRAEAKDHISESQNLDLRSITADQIIDNRDFSLQPIQIARIGADARIRLNNVFFDFNKADLKPESMAELNRIVTLLNERAGMQVEIAGHTDNIGSAAYNMNLSQRRANAVKTYLTQNGIDAGRIVAIGYGKTRPVVSNDDEVEGREINRRVEFRIISE
jgi:OOP family OmpA-OmpF porin